MFTRKPKLKVPGIYQLYGPTLYHEPGIGLDTTTTPEDAASAELVMTHIKAWCVRNGFIVNGVSAVGAEEHTPVSYLYGLNFRTLVIGSELDRLIAFLKDTEQDYTMGRILSLHTSLLTVGDVGYLTKLVNKLYHGLALVSPKGDQSWPEIHRAFPYLWVLWLIQLVIHQYAPEHYNPRR